jgi:ABC-type dipeptide/oligopeptide/nickel transport system permease subunit
MKAWRRFRHHPPAMIGLTIVVIFVALAILAPVISPYDPNAQDLAASIKGPSGSHWLGTDQLGRDVATRLMYGARISLLIGVLAVGIGLVIGVPLGMIAGYYGGWADLAISRFAYMMFAFTSILLALTLVAVLGVSILLAAGLGFLGLGVQSPTAEWGTMLGEGRQFIFSAPHLTTFPGIAIFLAILAFNLLGDGLRDALDPRLRTVDGPAG